MHYLVSRLVSLAQRGVGRSRLAVRLAVKIKNQCDMIVGAHMAAGNMLPVSGEEWLAGLLAPHTNNFVDVGANVGEWSLAFARRMAVEPEGLLFEPSPQTASHLRALLSREASRS